MGVEVAKPSTIQTATTRRQPGATNRPTVKARKPQAATATRHWKKVKPNDCPTSFMTKGTSTGRCPAQKPVDRIGCPATVAYEAESDHTNGVEAPPCQKMYQANPHQPARADPEASTDRRSKTGRFRSAPTGAVTGASAVPR